METTQNAQTQEVEVSTVIIPAHFRGISPEGQDKIVRDIQEKGLLQEIVVAEMPDGRKELVAGQRRLKAVTTLGYQKVRARVLPVGVSELQKALIMIAENEEKEDVSPIDKALSYQRVKEIGQFKDQRELANRLGLADSTMSEYLALARLPEDLRKSFGRPKLGLAHLTEILRLPKPEDQVKLAEEASREGLTSKEVRSRVKKLLAPEGSKAQGKQAVQEETILDCHFLYNGKVVIVKPRAFKVGAESMEEYASDIQVGLRQFVTGLDTSHPKAEEVSSAA